MTFNIIKYSIPFKEEMKKFVAFITREKQAKNECKNNDSNSLRILQIVYKKLRRFFSQTCLSTCLKKDTPVLCLLKVTNI